MTGHSSSYPGSEIAIVFWYKNYKGEQGYRRAIPISIRYGTSEYHHAPQWLMLAFDTEKQAEREFAMSDMSHNVLGDQIVLRFGSVAQGAVDPELIALLGRLKAAASVMLFELKPGDSKNVHMHNLTDRERDLLACALPSTKLGSPK